MVEESEHRRDDIRAQRPVVVLARAVDSLEGLFVEKNLQSMAAGEKRPNVVKER